MSRNLIKTCLLLGVTGTSALALYVVWKKLRERQIGRKYDIHPKKVRIVSRPSEWDQLYPTIRDSLLTCKVLGFDCEWVPLAPRGTRPVALLQLATPGGLCVLVRMIYLEEIPNSLCDLLADKSILKVGVGCLGDAHKLLKDYAVLVRGCIDLRHLAIRRPGSYTGGLGLKALTKNVLGGDLDKNILVRAGNWELEHLTDEQINYAATDALVGVKIFLVIANEKLGKSESVRDEPITDSGDWARILSMCQGLTDNNFKHQPQQNGQASSSRASARRVDTGGSKPSFRAYCHRQRPLYHNCQLRAPDGQLLCTIDQRKVQWYLDKGLGDKVCDEPLTIQLKFEPAGRPVNDQSYYLQDKENICVVCGAGESYIRKHIVPVEYRKYFPAMMKSHRSHDVLLLCSDCHQLSSAYDLQLKQKLASHCGAPLGNSKSQGFSDDHDLLKVKSAAKAILRSSAKIPERRLKELYSIVQRHYGVGEVSDALLQKTVTMDTKMPNTGFEPHGQRVVQHTAEREGLVEFERMWRQHFVDTVSPKHLPPMWSVHHSHDEIASVDQSMQDQLASIDQS